MAEPAVCVLGSHFPQENQSLEREKQIERKRINCREGSRDRWRPRWTTFLPLLPVPFLWPLLLDSPYFCFHDRILLFILIFFSRLEMFSKLATENFNFSELLDLVLHCNLFTEAMVLGLFPL